MNIVHKKNLQCFYQYRKSLRVKGKKTTLVFTLASGRAYCGLSQQHAWKSMFLFGISSLLINVAR